MKKEALDVRKIDGVFQQAAEAGRHKHIEQGWAGGLCRFDEKTVIVALARGRTFANLEENPNAVFMIMEPGAGILDWKGIRVYLKMLEFATSGPKLENYKSQMAKIVGEQAAGMIAVLATFEVTEVRPLIDFGQGWEKAI